MQTLAELPAVFVDCQTTGGSSERHHLIEVAWCVGSARAEGPGPVWSSAIRLPDGERLPPAIGRITGIRQGDLDAGIDTSELYSELAQVAAGLQAPSRFAIAHYARFEESFLRALHGRQAPGIDFPIRFLCTYEIGRRLFPDLPRRGLRALSGFLGTSLGELKRAPENARATWRVWNRLVEILEEEHDILTIDSLEQFLAEPPPKRSDKWVVPLPREKRLSLPKRPGVYKFLGGGGEILYIGKATSLKDRVNSYFRARKAGDKVLQLITQVHDIEVTTTRSGLEAALLEAESIQEISPPYNRALRDLGQEVAYSSADLSSVRGSPDLHHRHGPFPGRDPISTVRLLFDALAVGPAVMEDPQSLWHFGIEKDRLGENSIVDGIELFRSECLLGPADEPSRLWVVGTRLLEHRCRAASDEPEDPVLERDEAAPLDADAVAASLSAALVQATRLRNRSRWITRLEHSTTSWEVRRDVFQKRRVLTIEHGRVVHAETMSADEWEGRNPAPQPPRDRLPIDRPTYDRLRVLTTEIRRILSQGRRVDVHFSTGQTIVSSDLARVLDRV